MSQVLIAPFELGPLAPLIVVALGAIALLLLEAFKPGWRAAWTWVSLALVVLALALCWRGSGSVEAFPGLVADPFARLFNIIVLTATAGALLLGRRYHPDLQRGEYHALLLFSAAGMLVVSHATHFLTIFLGIETLSLALYVLTAYLRRREQAVEGAVKYFFLGSFAAAFLAYGMALVYAASGSLEIAEVARALGASGPTPLALAGLGLMVVGLGFKISAVPFHMWTPDAYEGAPTPVTGYMSVATKAVAFAALLRVLVSALPELSERWVPLMAGLAFVTMLGGNLVALTQRSLKRMLAYSSVAHAGYALVGVVAWSHGGKEAVLFYLLGYLFMNLGAFGVLSLLERRGEGVLLYDLSGLSQRQPWLAAAMALFMLSLTGVPATAGFVGKLYLIQAAVAAGWVKLAVFLGLYSAIAAYFYLRVIVVMYMRPPDQEIELGRPDAVGGLTVAALALGVLWLGLLPAAALELVNLSAAVLMP